MTKVQIDDFDCPNCDKITLAELDIKTGRYTCLCCGKSDFGEEEEEID